MKLSTHSSGSLLYVVALLRACVENEVGPPGSWTEEQVIEGGKRERDPRTYGQRNTQEQPINVEDTGGVRDRAKGHEYVCIYNLVYADTQAVTTDQAGGTDADACSSSHSGDTMEVLPEAHGRSSKLHEPPETCRKKLVRMTEEKRSVPVRQHFVLPNARSPFPHRLLFFYSSRREPFSSLILYLPNITT